MIIGLFVSNYKVYQSESFIPFFVDQPENLNLFIGNNGVGKSSILEAIDTYFNSGDWTVHLDAINNDVYSCPLLLLPKSDLRSKIGERELYYIRVISDFLWSAEYEGQKTYDRIENFFNYKKKLKQKYENSHFLILSGVKLNDPDPFFGPFNNTIKSKITNAKKTREEQNEEEVPESSELLNFINNAIKNQYTYLYIPVETSIPEFLKLETRGMQGLMKKDIKESIDDILTRKEFSDGEETGNYSIIDYVNAKLLEFVTNIEEAIQKIDSGYDFQRSSTVDQDLLTNDIRNNIIKSYFSKRKLRKDRKVIDKLSPGERKKALINIAYSFLSQEGEKDKNIVLAVDEPEASLHVSTLYEQFERIDELANSYGHQIFVTTHWYGSLPIVKKGVLQHITVSEEGLVSTPKIQAFNFINYFEQRGWHPDDIHLKSFFDLTASIVSALKNHENNWLIVEGLEDKLYIEHYLDRSISVKILPVGGAAIVKLIYEYLFLPLSQKSDSKQIKGKVFCLIDTDVDGGANLNVPSSTNNNILCIKRLQKRVVNDKIIIDLERMDSSIRSATEMEESLNPRRFYRALNETMKKYGVSNEKEAWGYFQFNQDEDIDCSFIEGDDSILVLRAPTEKSRHLRTYKKEIKQFVDKNKPKICEAYITLDYTPIEQEKTRPIWVKKIEDFFNT